MKRQLAIVILPILMLVSFGSRSQDVFPDQITAYKSEAMKRVKGTKLFIVAPPSYQPMEKLLRMQKNDDTYCQVIEGVKGNFTDFKTKMSRQAIESGGARVDVYETVTYNGLDGIYFEGPSKTDGQTKLGFAYGNDDFIFFIIGVCRTADQESKLELRQIFSTSYHDPSFDLDPLELLNFRLNEKITGFRYASSSGNSFLFLPKGRTELTSMADFSYFQVITLDAGSLDKMRELVEIMHRKLEQQGWVLSNTVKKELKIGDHRAFEILLDAKDGNGKTSQFYQVGIFQEQNSSGLIFNGVDTDGGAYLPKFRATVETMRWKP